VSINNWTLTSCSFVFCFVLWWCVT
jgi:hypothetical protein